MITERLVLRAWLESDAGVLYEYARNPEIGPAAGWPPHTSVEDSLNVIRTVFSAPETYAVVLKSTGEPVGSIGIMSGEASHVSGIREDEAEIGYWIRRQAVLGTGPDSRGGALSASQVLRGFGHGCRMVLPL